MLSVLIMKQNDTLYRWAKRICTQKESYGEKSNIGNIKLTFDIGFNHAEAHFNSQHIVHYTYIYVYRWAVQDDKYFWAFWAWLKLFVLIILLQLWVKLVYLNSESRVKNNIPTLWAQRYSNILLYNMRVKLLLYTYNFNAIIFNRSICHFRSLAQYSENCSIE